MTDEMFFPILYNIVSVNLPAYQLPSVHLPMLKLFTRTSPSAAIARIRKTSIDVHWFSQSFIIHGLIFMQCRQGNTIDRLTEAKIRELHVTILIQKKVIGFNISER